MQLINAVTLLAGLAAASPVIVDGLSGGPSGHEVQITGLAFAGSGCPAGSVSGQLSSDLTTLTLLYANFVAQAGNNISPSNYRKNCQLNVKLKYPSGWQFSVFKADYRGYAQIPQGDTGTCKATYYFSGDSRQVGFFPCTVMGCPVCLSNYPLWGVSLVPSTPSTGPSNLLSPPH